MSWVKPDKVVSPKNLWELTEVLYEGDKEETAVALGKWDGSSCLAMRWNGHGRKPMGNPTSRGQPTWFILPSDFEEVTLGVLREQRACSEEKLARASEALREAQ